MTVHTDAKSYKCPMCDEVFRHSASQNSHFRVHIRERLLTCSLCNKSFTQSTHLQTHKRLVHSHRRPYHCSYCSKTFKSNAYLKVNMFVFTLVQSRTHADIVLVVLKDCINSIDICCYHTMKVEEILPQKKPCITLDLPWRCEAVCLQRMFITVPYCNKIKISSDSSLWLQTVLLWSLW